MANFLFIYRGGNEGYQKMTPDEMQNRSRNLSGTLEIVAAQCHFAFHLG